MPEFHCDPDSRVMFNSDTESSVLFYCQVYHINLILCDIIHDLYMTLQRSPGASEATYFEDAPFVLIVQFYTLKQFLRVSSRIGRIDGCTPPEQESHCLHTIGTEEQQHTKKKHYYESWISLDC